MSVGLTLIIELCTLNFVEDCPLKPQIFLLYIRLHTVTMLRSHIRLSAVALLATLSEPTLSLEVSPNSPCASKCLDSNTGNASWRNQSLTFNDMLPCYNWEYSGDNSTAVAIKFASCQECQMRSGWQTSGKDGDVNYSEKDSTWFLCRFLLELNTTECLLGGSKCCRVSGRC